MIYSISPSGRRPNVLPSIAEESKHDSRKAVSNATGTMLRTTTSNRSSTRGGVVSTIVAPSGDLGIVVKSNPDSGLSFVSRIKDNCPIKEKIRVGDQILEVDGEDVSKLKVIHVASESKLHFKCYVCHKLDFIQVTCFLRKFTVLLRSKRKNGSRILTIIRTEDETTRVEF